MAIFGTMPVRTAPNPLYRPNAVSLFTISVPVVMNPRFFACNVHQSVTFWIVYADRFESMIGDVLLERELVLTVACGL